jgi:hypothetical protein
MPNPSIEIRGLDELLARMRQFPKKLDASMRVTMQAALLALWENVPAYPPPPDDSTYVRTGTMGRTLGSGEGGGKSGGQPDIYEVRELGSGYEGHFGTNLDYAPHVIGEETQAKHMGHWWKISVIKEKAQEKIQGLFKTMGDKMAEFLEGKGL